MAFPWRQQCRATGLRGWLGTGGGASGWCGRGGDKRDLPSEEPNRRPAHRAKRASSDRSDFFRPGVLEAGAGDSTGGEGRLGTISAALALSSRNLSNSAIQNQGMSQNWWRARPVLRLKQPHPTRSLQSATHSCPQGHPSMSAHPGYTGLGHLPGSYRGPSSQSQRASGCAAAWGLAWITASASRMSRGLPRCERA